MSVTVKHLNEDSSFLLLFSPETPPSSTDAKTLKAAYSILIDPWLRGVSIVTAPWFAITKRVVPACIQHLCEIDEPDVVVVSQNKPDHCHAETLKQLRPDGKTIIATEPGAAKTIKSWNHFDPARVLPLSKFDPQRGLSYATFYIPPLSPGGHRGVVTISFIPAKNYLTGLHNAIGITYLAPTHTKSVASVPTVDLPKCSPVSTVTPPSHPLPNFSSLIFNADSELQTSTFSKQSSDWTSDPNSTIDIAIQPDDGGIFGNPLPTPPQFPSNLSPGDEPMSHNPIFSTGSFPRADGNLVTAGRPRALSILYTPHGVPFKPDLLPYVQTHLVQRGALPLTVLLHSFDRSTNPWYFGGNITAGTEGGVQIARGLLARCWLSAHDEAKDDQGLSVKRLKTSRMDPEGVRRALWEGQEGEEMRLKGWNCDVRGLASGQEMVIGQSRDLLCGMENIMESRLMKSGPPPLTITTDVIL